jgi:3-hydroxyacyl-[acyl-carrier-protein] dehydratase
MQGAPPLLAGFTFLDQVHLLVRNRRIEGTSELAAAAGLLASHFPLRPMVPGSLLLEALSQLGGLLLESSTGFARKAIPIWIEQARFRRPVQAARTVHLTGTLTQTDPAGAVLDAVAHQDGQRCATARLGFALAPMANFYGPEHLRLYRAWVEARIRSACLIDFPASPLEVLREFGG